MSEETAGGGTPREGGVPAWAKASDCTHSARVGKRQGISTEYARNVSAKSSKNGRGDGVVLRSRALLKGKRLVRNITVTDKFPSKSSAASGALWCTCAAVWTRWVRYVGAPPPRPPTPGAPGAPVPSAGPCRPCRARYTPSHRGVLYKIPTM